VALALRARTAGQQMVKDKEQDVKPGSRSVVNASLCTASVSSDAIILTAWIAAAIGLNHRRIGVARAVKQ